MAGQTSWFDPAFILFGPYLQLIYHSQARALGVLQLGTFLQSSLERKICIYVLGRSRAIYLISQFRI